MRLLVNHGFFGTLLLSLKFALLPELEKKHLITSTDGKTIYFNPTPLDKLSNLELDIVIMHEVMHIALKHNLRGKRYDDLFKFNQACDIVVNSNIKYCKNLKKNEMRVLGHELPYLAPDGKEGYNYSAEEIYQMLMMLVSEKTNIKGSDNSDEEKWEGGDTTITAKDKFNEDNLDSFSTDFGDNFQPIDSHEKWDDKENKDRAREDQIDKKVIESYELASHRKEGGAIPLSVERYIKDLKKTKTDWKTLLNNFIQENIIDYSFCPPDKRFPDSDFILPDFNDPDDLVKNVLFMVDTSGSMGEEEILECFSEINSAISQFDGKLEGFVGFFDAKIQKVVHFDEATDIREIMPQGGGGTDFYPIFEYVQEKMRDNLPSSIVILTDGYADFPPESVALGIPVLWIINNEDVTPPFGLVTRINIS